MATPAVSSPIDGVIKKVNRGKKRQINYLEWKQIKKKKLKNSGQEYTSSSGNLIPAKTPPTSDDVCSLSCTKEGCAFLNQSLSQKHYLFNMFYGFNYNEQQQFLTECFDIIEPQRRVIPEGQSTRQCTVKYTFPTQKRSSKLNVCQKQIINTLNITKRRIQLLINKITSNNDIFDKRGTHGNRPRKIHNSERALVEDHIRSFPCQESHYARNSSKTLYLSPDLNITVMFNLFKSKHPDSLIKLHTYRRIFNEKFNLKFGLPRSDTCKTCDRYFIQMAAAKSEEELNKLRTEAELHHRKAEKGYNTLSNDVQIAKDNVNYVVLCVDLEQVIFTPNLKHSDIFYQRQLSNYNFCIHNMGANIATMCVWSEMNGKRGSAETASCILHYIVENYQILMPHETRSLVLWSDRCIGQNNNWKMLTLCHYLVQIGYFTEVSQKFLITGHSFLPCDRDFALIEKKKKTASLNVPDDVVNMIQMARSNNPFKIQKMEGHFLDFSPVEEQIYKHPDLRISECRWIQFTKDSPTEVRTQIGHNTLETWSAFKFVKRGRRTNSIYRKISPASLERLYSGGLPISTEKKKDLQKMVEYLPIEHRQFYMSLVHI